MRNISKFIGMVVLAFGTICSCTKNLDTINAKCDIEKSHIIFNASAEPQTNETKADDGFCFEWNVGDQISVSDGSHKAVFHVTEATGLNAHFEYLSGDELDEGAGVTYTAYYPSSIDNNVLPSSNEYANDGNRRIPMRAQCSGENRDLKFKNLTGVIAINIQTTDNIETIALSGNKGLCGTFSINDAYAAVMDGKSSVSFNLATPESAEEGKTYYIPAPAGSYDIFCIGIFADDGKCQILKSNKTINIYRSKITSIGPLQINTAVPVSLNPDGETANCYVLPQGGTYKFYVGSRGNEGTSVSDINPEYSEVLWESINRTSECNEGDIICPAFLVNGYMFVKTNNTYTPGNALIAVKDTYDNILWSWHMWLTSPKDVTLQRLTDKGALRSMTFMDRNLGASASGYTESGVLMGGEQTKGTLYQWGRKDPFVKKSTMTPSFNVDKYAGNHGDESLDFAIKHPCTYLHPGASAGKNNWYADGSLTTEDGKLWKSDSKTIYDPCPVGYRVTTSDICYYNPVFNSELGGAELNTLPSDASGSKTWLPIAGTIGGSLEFTTDGEYHTSTTRSASNGQVRIIRMSSSNGFEIVYNGYTRIARSVRCLKETK